MAHENDVTVLNLYISEVNAYLAKAYLEENGITAAVMGDHTSNAIMGFMPQGKWRLVVRKCDYDEAQKLMEAYDE
ncbi:MAG: DUF2007 domain-containing protein, partial [Muribaculaceae bacterium]|nr:DUF2007 domain-containing protein [Muribaculaceae bacterium]